MDDADPKDVVPEQSKSLVWVGTYLESLMFLDWLKEKDPYAIRYWRHQWEKERDAG